jgi:NADH-quinone oxidoreductase subunit E
MPENENKTKTKLVLKKYKNDKSALIDILHDTQAEIGYLPREALEIIGKGIDVPLSRIYGIVTFFKAFSLTPRGRNLISVCMGTACHVRGADKVLEQIENELGIKSGENTPDLKFTLETVNCIGSCALGPMVTVGADYHGQVNPENIGAVLAQYK